MVLLRSIVTRLLRTARETSRLLALLAVAAGGCGRVAFDPAITPGDAGGDGDDGPPPVPRCGPGETAGPFTTDFENGVPMFGSIYEVAPARMDVFAGQLRGRPAMAPGANTYAGFEATVADYRSRRAFVEVPDARR